MWRFQQSLKEWKIIATIVPDSVPAKIFVRVTAGAKFPAGIENICRYYANELIASIHKITWAMIKEHQIEKHERKFYKINGKEYFRIRYNDIEQPCEGCGVTNGELHMIGCYMERCPVCGHQIVNNCACNYDPEDVELIFS